MSAPPLLAALAAVFAPTRAPAALARTPDPALGAEGARLAPLPRAERLAALAEALPAAPSASPRAREAAAIVERPRLAALLRAGAEGAGGGWLGRLVADRLRSLHLR